MPFGVATLGVATLARDGADVGLVVGAAEVGEWLGFAVGAGEGGNVGWAIVLVSKTLVNNL